MLGNYKIRDKKLFGRVPDVQKRPWKAWVSFSGTKVVDRIVEVRAVTKIDGKNQE